MWGSALAGMTVALVGTGCLVIVAKGELQRVPEVAFKLWTGCCFRCFHQSASGGSMKDGEWAVSECLPEYVLRALWVDRIEFRKPASE